MKIEWLGITKDELERGIIERFDCKHHVAENQAMRIANLAEPLRREFIAFWKTGTGGTTLEYGGWGWDRLRTEWKMQPIGAWTTMDQLCRDPEKTAADLNKGYDFIGKIPPNLKFRDI